MKSNFLITSSKVSTNPTSATSRESTNQSYLDNINKHIDMVFYNATTLVPFLSLPDLKDIDLINSIYAIVPKDQELSYEAFNFITIHHNFLQFYYQDNNTILVLKDFFKQDVSNVFHIMKILKTKERKIKLQFSIIAENYNEQVRNIKLSKEKVVKVLEYLESALNMLQIACSFKLPPNYPDHKEALQKNSINYLKKVLKQYHVSITDLDSNLSAVEQYKFLIKKTAQIQGIKIAQAESMLEDEEQWDKCITALVNVMASTLEEKCLAFEDRIFHKTAAKFLTAVYDRFLILKKFCNFTTRTYYLYPIFNLDILINIIFKDFTSESAFLTEQRKILIYIDRYQNNSELNSAKVMLAHLAMLKLSILKNDYDLMKLHFAEFKKNFSNNTNKTHHIANVIFWVLPEQVQKMVDFFEKNNQWQDAVDVALDLRRIINDIFNKKLTVQQKEKFAQQKEKVDANCRDVLTKFLAIIRKKTQENKDASALKNDVAIVNSEDNEYKKNSKPEEKPPTLSTAELCIPNEIVTPHETSTEEAANVESWQEIKEKNISSNSSSIIYSQSSFLWSSLNEKVTIEAKLHMKNCIEAEMTDHEIRAALNILTHGRITGAVGNGIKLVTDNEQKDHNLQGYFYKIKHVDLNFRVFGRYYIINNKRELIFDYVVRGHKNNSRNTPKNVAISNDISPSPAKSRR